MARAATTDVFGNAAPAASPPSLCVVITTHDRPAACAALLRALHASLEDAQLVARTFALVLIDRADADYAPVVELVARNFEHHAVYESKHRIGKRGFWFTHQRAFSAIQQLRPAHSLFLQDDLTLERSFVRQAFAHWDAIDDRDKAVLSLCAAADDEPAGRWIEYERQALTDAGVWRTQWFDLPAFLAHPRFFQRLHYEVFPVPAWRWRYEAARSSGVGEQFTLRLFGRANVYQVRETLVYHGSQPSLMNPDARQGRPLDNRAQIR